ncbi:hypothetical protein FRC03_009023, partial [Tulasnella sp. 419]
MAKWTYGIPCVHDFDPKDPKHIQRKSLVQTNPLTGKQCIEGGFRVTLKKGTVVHETELTRFPFWHSQPTQTAATLQIALECYRGDVSDLKFRDEDREGPPDQFEELCRVNAVIPESSYERRRSRVEGKAGKYYVSNFEVVVSFGATEHKCYIEWKDEKGNIQRGPVTPIWNDGPMGASRSSRCSPESRLQGSSSILNGKVTSDKAEIKPQQVRHILPRTTSPAGVSKTNLIISFDLGTTFSAASWVLVGNSPDPPIYDVSEYRENLPAKVPTVLYYDSIGKLRAVGSETLDKRNIADALEQEWTRVEWLKLLLLSDSLAHQLCRAPTTELPRNKNLVEVIADFLQYMHNLSLKHFNETMEFDRNSLQEMEDRITYIFSHPNGWNIPQHPLMREAAIRAGLVPDSEDANDRIIFVSEAEASLHWCIQRRLAIRDLEVGSTYIVVDAGGGVINISSFRTVGTGPPVFEESSIPECHLEGSAFVTKSFKYFVQDKLRGSSFGNPDAIERMVKDFDSQVKHGFRDRQQEIVVNFGKSQDNDPKFGINEGKLAVRGEEMAELFEPTCSAIVNSVNAKVVHNTKTAVVLVGGFSGNRYLFKEIQSRLRGILVTRPNDAA